MKKYRYVQIFNYESKYVILIFPLILGLFHDVSLLKNIRVSLQRSCEPTFSGQIVGVFFGPTKQNRDKMPVKRPIIFSTEFDLEG
jgi:hypothetical protein